jgi:hypothetical protein
MAVSLTLCDSKFHVLYRGVAEDLRGSVQLGSAVKGTAKIVEREIYLP